MTSKRFQRMLDQARTQDDYWIHNTIHDFTEDLYTLMERRGITKGELAKRIDSSPAYITKVMRGNTNFTVATMVRLVRALEGELKVKVCANEDETRWFHVVQPKPLRQRAQRRQFKQVHGPQNGNHSFQTEDDDILSATA